jgi:endonuclease/exonuclease/phosphatase family metal-dependent hydrolase
VLTWNIQWGRGADGRVDLGRVARTIEQLGMPELICLQEVADGFTGDELPGHGGNNQFDELSSLFPGHHSAIGVAVDMAPSHGRRRRFGNLILSRCPIGTVRPHLLPWPPDPDCRSMQRVALEVMLRTTLGEIRLTTTHLEFYSSLQRREQVERLRTLHAEGAGHGLQPRRTAPAGGPYDSLFGSRSAILTGDFNCGPRSPERARLTAAFSEDSTLRLVDAWDAACPGMAHPMTAGVHDRVQWNDQPVSFDAILVTEDLAARVRQVTVDPTTIASDHQPVLLDLDIGC